MELALVVYLVATLGAIKAFVSGWWWLIFVMFIVSYLVVKLKLIQFAQNNSQVTFQNPTWDNLRDGDLVCLTKPVQNFPVGSMVYVNKYNSHGYLSTSRGGSDCRVDADALIGSIRKEVVQFELTKTPLDVNINKLKYIVVVMLCLHLFLPTEKTLQYAAGAYLIQTTYQSEFVQEAGSLAGKAVTNQLKKWAESNPDIDTLLDSVEVTKDKVDTISK